MLNTLVDWFSGKELCYLTWGLINDYELTHTTSNYNESLRKSNRPQERPYPLTRLKIVMLLGVGGLGVCSSGE